jgi:ubiquinone/menaquinone biosynthesis C-methylase UbiE
MQNKFKEIEFFNQHANKEEDYNVFTNDSNQKIVETCLTLSQFPPRAKLVDLGCGAGIFTKLLYDSGFKVVGVDISERLIEVAQKKYPYIEFMVGDVEKLSFASESFDGVFLSAILHHLPDPSICAGEVFRILRAGGKFVAFDPNRYNPFMYLYRDKSSLFYSNRGVTENERPIVAKDITKIFIEVGFKVSIDYLSGLKYRYIASPLLRKLLPLYNVFDDILFRPQWLKPYRAFVITQGMKPL